MNKGKRRLGFTLAFLLVAAGLGLLELRRRAGEERIRAAETDLVEVRDSIDQLKRDLDDALAEVQLREAAAEPPSVAAEVAEEVPSTVWERNLAALRQAMADHPEWTIPEFAFLTQADLAQLASRLSLIDTEEEGRLALRDMRILSKRALAPYLQDAAFAWAEANGGELPADIVQLADYSNPALPKTVLQRYEFVPGVKSLGVDYRLSTPAFDSGPILRERFPVDPDFDTQLKVYGQYLVQSDINPDFGRALVDYAKVNSGRSPAEPADLIPFLPRPMDPADLQEQFAYWNMDPSVGFRAAGATPGAGSSGMVFRMHRIEE